MPVEYLGTFTLGEDPERNVRFIAAYDGLRAPISVSQFRQWLAAEAASRNHVGGAVPSMKNSPENCTTIPALAAP